MGNQSVSAFCAMLMRLKKAEKAVLLMVMMSSIFRFLLVWQQGLVPSSTVALVRMLVALRYHVSTLTLSYQATFHNPAI